MFREILRKLGLSGRARGSPAPVLPDVERETVARMLVRRHGVPQLDWGVAAAWVDARAKDAERGPLVRAVAAAWLDELRDSFESDYRRWRTGLVEGLAPMDDNLSVSVFTLTEQAVRVVSKSLERLTGRSTIAPIGIVALKSQEEYLSFQAHFGPEEGEFATSGGVYLSVDHGEFPLIAFPCHSRWSLGNVIAHELTHHALHGLELPLWLEEGFTQMMEERATGVANFVLNQEMIERHRERWAGGRLEDFLSGAAFHSGQEDDQELAYHLSQMVVRSELQRRADAYFTFARAIREMGVEGAAAQFLGEGPEEAVGRIVGLE